MTKDELEKLEKELEELTQKAMNADWGPLLMEDEGGQLSLPVGSQIKCDHEWVKYTGLQEEFFYCRKCDEKWKGDLS